MVNRPHWGAVVVAAGRSERFGALDKTLVELCGKPTLERSVAAVLSDRRVRAIVVVGSPANMDACEQLAARVAGRECIALACSGGATRSASVRAGLAALPPEVTHVAVHDAARALVPQEVVAAVLDAAEARGAAVPVVPVASTLLVAGAGEVAAGTLERESAREVQTPQAARRDLLEDALQRYPDETDESTALFRAGVTVALVPGSRRNIKITVPEDLDIARALLATDEEQA